MADPDPARPVSTPPRSAAPTALTTTLPPVPLLSSYFIVRSKCLPMLPYCNKNACQLRSTFDYIFRPTQHTTSTTSLLPLFTSQTIVYMITGLLLISI